MGEPIPWDEAKGRVHRVLNRLAAMHIPAEQAQPSSAPTCRECKHGWPCQSRERIDEMRRLLPNVKPPKDAFCSEECERLGSCWAADIADTPCDASNSRGASLTTGDNDG